MRRKNRVETLLSANADFDAFIIKSPADIAYLVGITFPFPDQSLSAFSTACLPDNTDEEWGRHLQRDRCRKGGSVYPQFRGI